MNKPLRILHLEDDPDYCDLVHSLLAKEGFDAQSVIAGNGADFESAIDLERFDVILADYLVPGYDGLEALRLACQKCPETPVLLVSGTIGEEAAIESLKSGATDYVLKHFPERLGPAVRRAVEEAEAKNQRRRIETELSRREKYFRALTENALDILTLLDREGRFLHNSPSVKGVMGYEPIELAGQSAFAMIHPEDLPHVLQGFDYGLRNPDRTVTLEFRIQHKDGSWRYLEAVGQSRLDDREICGVVINSRDVSDRKQAEAGLRESEQQYRLVFHGNPTPMWVFDHETLAFLEVNNAALEHYGYTREEFLAMTLADIRAPKEVPAMIEYLHQLLAAPKPPRPGWAGVWRHRKKDGMLIDVEIRWSPISFRGRPASLAMANDITERKRAEQELRDSEQRFRDLFERSPDAIFVEDSHGIVLDINPAACRLHGLGRDELIGKGFCDLVPSELREEVTRDFQAFVEGRLEQIEGVSRTHDGRVVPVEVRASRINYAGKPAVLLHVRDITDRKLAEAALRSSEMLFHSVWDNSADGMRLMDENGIIVAVNEAFCKLVSLRREELEGKPFTVILAESEQPGQMLEAYRGRFRDRVIEKQIARRLRLHNGAVVTLEDTNSLVELRGQPPLLLGQTRDLTAQERLEEQLRQSQKMEAIGQLAGGVAHDFNNILTVIHGHASLLLAGGSLTGASARCAQQIGRAAERAAGLTRQLLAFSRRQVMQTRSLDMKEVVGNMTSMLGRILGEDIALQLHYSLHPALVQADAGMIEQVLLNLAINSRDAMPKGGVLAISISTLELDARGLAERSEARAGRFVCLNVTDTGCGIPPQHLRRIFEPFFTTKEVGKGTGLGLATVYGIVKQHQGWIEVESEVGKGTAFKVFLPRNDETPQIGDRPPAEHVIRGGTETILVVEDEALVRELACSVLTGHGYSVLQAESGAKALRVWQASKQRIDLLLTDLVMPDNLNGRELAEKLCAERPRLKVLFTSGYSADVVSKDSVLHSGLNFLPKPYHPHKLVLAVRDCLDAVN
jgi:two-component system, cell cycle sensor histidine kinase and response regulator CckA